MGGNTIRRILSVLLTLVFLAVFTAFAASCKANGPELAFITDVGSISDKSFNETTWNGVRAYAETNKLTYAYYRPSEDTKAARVDAIGAAVSRGAKVIVCPGFMFGDAIYDVQDKYPHVQFLVLDAAPHPTEDAAAIRISSNVYSVVYREEQVGFLAGYAAVMEGYTKLGFIGGMAVPAVVRYGGGFVQGADAAAADKSLKPGDITISYWYSGIFTPSSDIRTKMDGWYTGGIQVVFACGSGLYLSVVAAAEAANGKVIGVDVDQSAVSETVVTSAMKELYHAVQTSLRALYGNGVKWPANMAGKCDTLGAKEGSVSLATAAGSWRLKNFTVDQYKAVFDRIVRGQVCIDSISDTSKTPAVKRVTVDYQG